MRATVRPLAATGLLFAVVSLAPTPVTGAAKWDPIDPKELAETTPKVEKDADAEVLFWDVRVADESGPHTVYSNYIRIKIFTDRGREAQSHVDVVHGDSVHIKDLEARSVRRDGTVTEMKKGDVFERTVVKAGGFKVQATSFVLPAVETGGIVEYRWREVYDGGLMQNLRLPLSRDIPVRVARYRLVPLNLGSFMILQGQAYKPNPTLQMALDKNDTVVSMENIPARREEPFSPPIWDTEPWMLIYYDVPRALDPDRYWLGLAKSLAASANKELMATPAMKRAVESLSLDHASPDAKIAQLMALCRSKIKRMDVDTATEADRKGFKGNDSYGAAFDSGRGTANDLVGVFVALARAAGLDARLARVSSRADVAFDPAVKFHRLLWDLIVAVRDGEGWRYVDPTNDHAPAGHLTWSQEGLPALIGDDTKLIWGTTPASPPEWSLRARTATFRLAEDGTLEGDVAAEYSGHIGARFKEQDDHLSAAEREASLKEAITSRLPGAEVTAVAIENVTDPEKPYSNHYHLKVPAYAQRTGSRLLVQPAVLFKGLPPMFPETVRRNPISFEQAWKEVDRVRIELPAGYRLESPGAPAPVVFEPFGRYAMSVAESADGRTVEVTRESFIGGGQKLRFPADAYASVKQFFDGVAKADAHTLTLRRDAGGGAQ